VAKFEVEKGKSSGFPDIVSYFPRRLKGRSFHGKKRLSMFSIVRARDFRVIMTLIMTQKTL
jgi:hypothetical protein